MAVHIETGTMAHPEHYSSKLLDHLGLVAGMYDELDLGSLIDRLIPQAGEKRKVSIGQAVKAMVLNGLGFANRALYPTPLFFRDKPVERLVGEGIGAEDLNDDVLGRAPDSIYDFDPTALFSQLALQTVGHLGLSCRFGHLDATGFHADGDFNSNEKAEEGVIRLTKGYSRDHRPDLNQAVLQLICEQQAGIPLLMETLSGNNSDKESFRDTVKNHVGQLTADTGIEYLVADSALYVAETLKEMTAFLWISRVPETLGLARSLIETIAPELMAPPETPAFRSLGAVYGDVKQRWVVVYSPEAYRRAVKSVNKPCKKQSTAELAVFDKPCKQEFACEADARKALEAFKKKLKITVVTEERISAQPRYNGKGRPGKKSRPDFHIHRIEGTVASLPQERTRRPERKSCFILASNQTDCETLTDEELISAYKNQQKVERGFRFLKDPLFMASTLFLKSPERIMALMMVMTLCLLVYAALEHRIREALKEHGASFPSQRGEAVTNPTARRVFQYFAGIHVLVIGQIREIVLNLNEHQANLLGLLGEPYELLYSGSG